MGIIEGGNVAKAFYRCFGEKFRMIVVTPVSYKFEWNLHVFIINWIYLFGKFSNEKTGLLGNKLLLTLNNLKKELKAVQLQWLLLKNIIYCTSPLSNKRWRQYILKMSHRLHVVHFLSLLIEFHIIKNSMNQNIFKLTLANKGHLLFLKFLVVV